MNKIIKGDCIEEMKKLEENSVDAIITDPPYGLEFMGKEWDSFKSKGQGDGWQVAGKPSLEKFDGKNDWHSKPRPAFRGHTLEHWHNMEKHFKEFGIEALRVLKPGAFLLSFGGTRTYHRLVCGIEDAGFEIRDTIMWLYGSGFPKSLNIGKQIDKSNARGFEQVIKLKKILKDLKEKSKKDYKEIDRDCEFQATNYFRTDNQYTALFPDINRWNKLKVCLGIGDELDELFKSAEREVIGKTITNLTVMQRIGQDNISGEVDITLPATQEAKQWEGWGTALKPAVEPIVVARKPLSEKNIALNVLKHGTGGLNIDECRIEGESTMRTQNSSSTFSAHDFEGQVKTGSTQGRFPANIILDEEAGKLLDEQSGETSKGHFPKDNTKGTSIFNTQNLKQDEKWFNDKGGASRFFYCAKASKSERNLGCENFEDTTTNDGRKVISDRPHQRGASQRKNNHPTVKPIKLMEYLIKLVSREGAVVLDPFLGSGTTAIASLKLGRKFIGIEKEEEYIKISQARIKPFMEQTKLR